MSLLSLHVASITANQVTRSLNASEQQELQSRLEKRSMRDFMNVCELSSALTSSYTLTYDSRCTRVSSTNVSTIVLKTSPASLFRRGKKAA